MLDRLAALAKYPELHLNRHKFQYTRDSALLLQPQRLELITEVGPPVDCDKTIS